MKALLVCTLLYSAVVIAQENEGQSSIPAHCQHTSTVNSDVQIASLRFEEVKVPLILSLFILITLIAKLLWHHPWMHMISSNIPESCMLIVVGAHVGGIVVAAFRLDECNNNVFPLRFTSQMFFVFLLPPIIFASGYFLDFRALMENIFSILLFAFVGTIWNAFALGFTIFGLSAAGLTAFPFTIASALLYGTICAAVDPVAVLAVFDEIHVNKLLHILVFGESLLNDAVTVVLFQVLGAFANIPFDTNRQIDDTSIPIDIVEGVAQFIVVILASIVIGIIIGFSTAVLSKYTQQIHVLEPVAVYVAGYVSYLLADLFAFSGIVSLIVCAIIMKHYIPPNLTWKSNITIKYGLKMISVVAEMVIFLYLGISLFDTDVHKLDGWLILWTLVFATIFRPIGVIVLALLVNIFRFHKINAKQIFIMSYSGIRGAVAFSLALTRIFEEGGENLPNTEKDLRKSMLTATTVLVLFTVFVQGITINPLVKLIGVKLEKAHEITMNEIIHENTIDHINSGMEDIAGQYGFNRIWEFLHYIDVKYIRKYLERFPEAKDREIITKFNNLQFKETQKSINEYHEHYQVQEHVPIVDSPDDQSTHEQKYKDDAIPALDEILKAGRVHPHEDYYMHVTSREEMDEQEHRFQRYKANHLLKIRAKKENKKKLVRRHTTASFRSFSRTSLPPVELSDIPTSGAEGHTNM